MTTKKSAKPAAAKSSEPEAQKSAPAPQTILLCKVLVNRARLGGGTCAKGKELRLRESEAKAAAALNPPQVAILGVASVK